MKRLGRMLLVSVLTGVFWMPDSAPSQNLCVNGDFSRTDTNGLPEGWMCDFTWMGRAYWMNNQRYIRVSPGDGPHRNVLALSKGAGTDEPLIASAPIPYEHGKQYSVTMDARSDGPRPRMYIRGYKWKSGIRPHPDPHLSELQDVFRGKPFEGLSKTWKEYSRTFPHYAKDASSDVSLAYLKHVRFIVLYITIPCDEYPGNAVYIDNVDIRKR